MKFSDFLKNCDSCGGNWAQMILSGIKNTSINVYDSMPDRLYTFDEVCFIANHLCEDRPHLRYSIQSNNIIEFGVDGAFHYRKATEEELSMTPDEFDFKMNGISAKDRDSTTETVKKSSKKPTNSPSGSKSHDRLFASFDI